MQDLVRKPVPGLLSVSVHSVLHEENKVQRPKDENINAIGDVDNDTGESMVIDF